MNLFKTGLTKLRTPLVDKQSCVDVIFMNSHVWMLFP